MYFISQINAISKIGRNYTRRSEYGTIYYIKL